MQQHSDECSLRRWRLILSIRLLQTIFVFLKLQLCCGQFRWMWWITSNAGMVVTYFLLTHSKLFWKYLHELRKKIPLTLFQYEILCVNGHMNWTDDMTFQHLKKRPLVMQFIKSILHCTCQSSSHFTDVLR